VQAVGSALDDPDLIVEALDEAEGDFIFRLAIGGNSIPVSLNHLGELLVRLEPLPLQLFAPALEELPRPGFAVVVPQLTEGLLEQIRGIEAFVGAEQQLEGLARRAFEILGMREQRILLTLRDIFL
jgi:hypothetical protein